MILIHTPAGAVDSRITSDPRLSTSQQAAIKSAGAADERAAVVGLDAKLRPVVRARLHGPGRRVHYALLRNGDPTKPVEPLAEHWGGRG